MKKFQPSPLIEPREPIFREPIPIWFLMLLIFSIGFITAIGAIMIMARMFP